MTRSFKSLDASIVAARRVVGSSFTLARTKVAKLFTIVTVPEFWPAARVGVAAGTEHRATQLPTEVMTVLDVGASRGQFALYAHRLWPTAAIYCFEPIPHAARIARRIVDEFATVYETAIANSTGRVKLQISANDDSSSLLEIGRQADEFPGTHNVGELEVSVARLDEYQITINRPSLLKIDVQGSELEVLRGAATTLLSIDAVYCECSFVELYKDQPLVSDVMGLLDQAGFRLQEIGVIHRSSEGATLQADLLFVRPGTK